MFSRYIETSDKTEAIEQLRVHQISFYGDLVITQANTLLKAPVGL